MTEQLKQAASAHGKTQESRRTHLAAGHPATKTVPRGNGQSDAGEVRKSIERLNVVLGH